MKAILMSIRPEWVAKILNGEKTIEIRKKFPKDYVGWVYIYVTKDKNQLVRCQEKIWGYYKHTKGALKSYFNGKVVARFWCDRVEEIYFEKGKWGGAWADTLRHSCLTFEELENYLNGKGKDIHITKLEIFDKPKEIKEFKTHLGCNKAINCMFCKYYVFKECTRPRYLTRAPQSWCYVEI